MGEIAINPIHNVHKKYRTMNFVNHYIFTPPVNLSTNTEIGGVAANINTPQLLATKLAIDVSRITNFAVVGADIKCRITGNYILNSTFSANVNIVKFIDNDNLMKSYGDNVFDGCVKLNEIKTFGVTSITGIRNFQYTDLDLIYLPNLTSVYNIAFNEVSINKTKTVLIYIPECVIFGDSPSVDNQCFFGLTSGSIIYAHPSMATANAGSAEADLAYAISIGCVVRYVVNKTAPNAVSNLTSGIIYNTAIQLNFTPPSTINAIEFYEVYVNDVFSHKIYGSGEYVVGLQPSTNYNIKIKAVDVLYNKSLASNTLLKTTILTNPLGYQTETYLFQNRVGIDGGTVVDLAVVDNNYATMKSITVLDKLIFCGNSNNVKKDGNNLVEKLYSLDAQNRDIIQTTLANKPIYTTDGLTFNSTNNNFSKTFALPFIKTSISMMVKIKTTNTGDYWPVFVFNGITFHSTSNGSVYCGVNNSTRFTPTQLGAGTIMTGSVVNSYVFTYNLLNNEIKFYRNNVLLATKTDSAIGFGNTISIQNVSGKFYSYKIFSKVLNVSEITSLSDI